MNDSLNTQTITEVRKLKLENLASEWRERLFLYRNGEESCRRHGAEDMAKWHEGQADALDRCISELEVATKREP